MTVWAMLVLAVVQGVAEFLPISSSGHLVLMQEWLGVTADRADINIVLHLGTLVSVLICYHDRIVTMVTRQWRVAGLVIAGTIPTAVIGLTVKRKAEYLLEDPLLTGFMLLFTAGFLVLADRYGQEPRDGRPGDDRTSEGDAGRTGRPPLIHLPWRLAVLIGIAQGAAVLPGLSRSGITIAIAVMVGLSRRDAAAFSFLLAIPAIAGGAVLESKDLLTGESVLQTPPSLLLGGAAVSALVGTVALAWLRRMIERMPLWVFSCYCLPLGVAIVLWQLTRQAAILPPSL